MRHFLKIEAAVEADDYGICLLCVLTCHDQPLRLDELRQGFLANDIDGTMGETAGDVLYGGLTRSQQMSIICANSQAFELCQYLCARCERVISQEEVFLMVGFEPVYKCPGAWQQFIAPVYYSVQVYQIGS